MGAVLLALAIVTKKMTHEVAPQKARGGWQTLVREKVSWQEWLKQAAAANLGESQMSSEPSNESFWILHTSQDVMQTARKQNAFSVNSEQAPLLKAGSRIYVCIQTQGKHLMCDVWTTISDGLDDPEDGLQCLISPLRTIGNRKVTCCDGGVPIDPATLMCQSCKDDPAMGMPTATGDMPVGEISLHPLEKWQVEILDQLIVLPKARV